MACQRKKPDLDPISSLSGKPAGCGEEGKAVAHAISSQVRSAGIAVEMRQVHARLLDLEQSLVEHPVEQPEEGVFPAHARDQSRKILEDVE